ncbi:peroxisomal targeting signal 2 receptor-like [Pollicipes pollicipes]|uniref:peroxisomal targeting signal 2 receptor-like n=1 Tax=Pollicipes pollicipes TaxID=41117 RepID=UPI0018856DE1|nr:peroxisomal targeting signal 2 receptor-like [Pollicipes pollicipes]
MYPLQASCELPGYHCYAVAWSPFHKELLAVVSGTNYGLSGAGRLDVLRLSAGGAHLAPSWSAPWQDVITDVTWSETSPSALVVGTGDRAVAVFDTAKTGDVSLVRREHAQEVSCVTWSPVRSHQAVLSASWDGTAKQGHRYAIKKVRFSSFDSTVLATASYDKTCRLWSCTEARCLGTLESHTEFVYGLDWSVLERQQLATCGWDRKIQVHTLPA